MAFKAITIESTNGRFMEIISKVGISVPVEDSNDTSKVPTTYWTTCLWDTGASHSAISKEAAEILGLQPIGEAAVLGMHGESITNFYRASITLPDLLFLPDIKVTECVSNEVFGVILGMDVICLGDFAITNQDDITTFSFCTPSLGTINYLEKIADLEKGGTASYSNNA